MEFNFDGRASCEARSFDACLVIGHRRDQQSGDALVNERGHVRVQEARVVEPDLQVQPLLRGLALCTSGDVVEQGVLRSMVISPDGCMAAIVYASRHAVQPANGAGFVERDPKREFGRLCGRRRERGELRG
ncbi:hypothetical protein [Microbacterium sp. PRC9]|uniref:hypothetical protein n=1 Tax=Microbacterium sp. PRC9 TaxID=2962591 RepID=UPI0028821430|nr:hypothetical protein [Microbacterium sp. PRC9]MDT0144559.1 hypothetical protein [Microbacterium sp. PRC9]